MTSEPASVISHLQEPDRDEPLGAAKIPLKHKGLNIASQMRSVEQAGPDLASTVGSYSTSVDRTLSAIDAIESTLQRKRRQIEEIQARQEILALEYRQLGRSLDTATKDLADQFIDIIADLETDKPAAELPVEPSADEARETNASAEKVPESSATSAESLAEEAPETNATSAEPPAEKAPETSEALDLERELSDLPPVPEFLGGRQDSSDQMGDSASRDTGSGSRPWWKHAKKG
jgi:chromosome segregation ATPase